MGSCVSTAKCEQDPTKNIQRKQVGDLDSSRKKETIIINSIRKPLVLGKFSERYELIELIGTGGQSSVFSSKNITAYTKTQVAVKIVRKDSKNIKMSRQDFEREIMLINTLSHRGIISLCDFYDEPSRYIFVMELAKGGDLTTSLLNQGVLSEREAKGLMLSLTNAVNYMHSKGIVHRDLKCDNILLRSLENYSDVMISDFGFATECEEGSLLTAGVGTPHYVAPELIQHSYGNSVDIWALGVILFIVLSGHFPFDHPNRQILLSRIVKGQFSLDEDYFDWSTISKAAKYLILNILVVDVKQRYTADEILSHPWLEGAELDDENGLQTSFDSADTTLSL